MISYGGLVNTAPKLKLISYIIQNTPNRNATRYNLIMQATRVYDEFMFDNIMYFIYSYSLISGVQVCSIKRNCFIL
jgi:hypothetical protein